MRHTSRVMLLLLVTTVLAFGVGGAHMARAQSQSAGTSQPSGAGNGIRISPVRSDIVIKPGESRSITMNVQNITAASAEFQAIVNDFVASNNESGQPALILDSTQYAPSRSLKRYIAAIPNLTIPAGQSKNVQVTITIPKDAPGGGYFGAVRFTSNASGTSNKNVTLSASVGSLILVRVPGDIVENMRLTSFDVRTSQDANSGSKFFTSNKNLYAVPRFQNNGNVHEQPFGKIILKKGDKVLQTTEINNTDPRANVLPDSIRRFAVKLDKVGMWGKYTVEGNFGYSTNGQLISGKTSFYVVPIVLILVMLGALAVIVFAIFGLPRAIRRYNDSVVRRSRRPGQSHLPPQ